MRKVYLAKLEVELRCDQVVRLEQLAERMFFIDGQEIDLSRALRFVLIMGWQRAEAMFPVLEPR